MDTNNPASMVLFSILVVTGFCATIWIVIECVARLGDGGLGNVLRFAETTLTSWKFIAVASVATLCVTAIRCAEITQPAEMVPVVTHSERGWTIYRVATHKGDYFSRYERITDSAEESARKAASSGS